MEEDFVFKDTQDLSFLINRVNSAHTMYKDLLNPTVTWDTTRAKESTINPDYVPKQTVFLREPVIQKQFREDFIEEIAEVPSPHPLYLQSDMLLDEFLSLKLRAKPELVKDTLAKFYHTQVHYLQQFKYKYILNWANICQHVPVNVNIIKDQLRKIDAEMLDCVESYERLRSPEDTPLIPTKKEQPRGEIPILPRDLDYFITTNAQKLKDSRGIKGLSYRLKWTWVSNRTEIWKKSVVLMAELKLQSISRMKLLTGLDDIGAQKVVVSLITNVNLKNLKRQQEIKSRAKADHSVFAEEHKNLNDQLLASHKDEIDSPPQLITQTKQLNGLLDSICKEYMLVGDVDSDNGHTLSYQIASRLPEVFEIQRKRQEWKPYEPPDKEITNMRMAYIQSLKRSSTLKKHGTEILPNSMTGYKFLKPLSMKKPDWLHCRKITPQIPIWQRRQGVRLKEFNKEDSLLRSSFELLEVQDLPTINRIIEEFSMNYCERASKKGVLRTDLGLSNEDIKKRYFSSLLVDNASSGVPSGEEQINLLLITIKGLFTLKFLKSRGYRQNLFDIFNYYRSTERKLRLDITGLHKATESVFTQSTQSANPLLESLDGEITQYLPDKMPEIYGREDSTEFLEGNIYIIDETGEYIIYSQVEEDVKTIVKELLLLGSFYIDKFEVWSEDQGENYPVIDRDLLVNELLELEVKFQETKVELVADYLEIYKHSVKPSQQLQISQKIMDLIALRPRLYLQGSYFAQSYWAHTQALEQHSIFLKTVLSQYNNPDGQEILPFVYTISEFCDLMNRCVGEISVIQETESPIAYSTREHAVWEHAHEVWRASKSYKSPFQEGIILDDYSQVSYLMRSLKEEVADKELLPKLQASMFETKTRGAIPKDVPSEMQITCNALEAFRFREYLEQHYEETQVLEGVYRKQCIAMKRENVDLEFINFFPGNPHISNLRDWPGSKSHFRLPAYEISPVLTENLNLTSPGSFKAMLINPGLEELKAVTEYQATHKHLLIIATQLNQSICDRLEREIAEIEIARSMEFVCKKTKVQWQNVLGRKGEGLVEEKAENEIKSIRAKIYSGINEMFTDCRRIKAAHRESMKASYLRIMQKYAGVLGERSGYTEIVSRALISQLVNGYCREILREVYTLGIKVHIIKVMQEAKRMVRVLPAETYNRFCNKELFFDAEMKVNNLMAIPTVEAIMALPVTQNTWKNWDPYLYAETPDVLIKKIKSMAFGHRASEAEVSNIALLGEWTFSSDLKSLLQLLRGYLHIAQIVILLKFLSVKSIHVMDLQDLVLEGVNYWEKRKVTENSEEIHLRAVEELISNASPVETLYQKIEEALEEIKSVCDQCKELPAESQVAYMVLTATTYFRKFAVISFESLESSLEVQSENDSEEISNWITPMFRYNRKSLHVKKSRVLNEQYCPLITLCHEKIIIDNSASDTLGSAWIQEFDIAFLSSSETCRKKALDQYSVLESRLKQHASNKIAKEIVPSLEVANGYLEVILQAKRLKSAYLMIENGEDLVVTPAQYSKVNCSYLDSIGLKTEIASKVIREEKYLAASTAQVKLLRDSFSIRLCKFTIDFIQNECSRVLDTSRLVNNISLHNEFTCNADRNYNDVTRKIGCLHLYLNCLRNRCTLVEAPTCGKAQVYLVKDMTKLTKKFLDNIVKFMETEYRTREESFQVQLDFYERLKTQKDQEIAELSTSFKSLQFNLDNLVNSQLSQKGNSLIYELDRSHRKLQEIKANIRLMPAQAREIVYLDYKEDIETNGRRILDIKQSFTNFKGQLTQELKADISMHKTLVFTEIKGKTSKSKAKELSGLMADDASYTKKKQGVDLRGLQDEITLIRTMKKWAQAFKKNKFQKNISELEEQLSSNQYLWEHLNESQRREALLKQELSYTQQSLASAEKLADKLQTSIEDMNNQRLRLQQYKSNKGKRLNELEIRVKQQEKVEHKDNQVLLGQFYLQNDKMQALQVSEEKAGQEYIPHHIRYQKEIQHLKKTLMREQSMKLDAFEELNKFRNQMKNLNKNPDLKVRDLKLEHQKLAAELKSIKDQNGIFKKRMVDLGDTEFLAMFQNKINTSDMLSSLSSKDSRGGTNFLNL